VADLTVIARCALLCYPTASNSIEPSI
jgi:hypothetical protein